MKNLHIVFSVALLSVTLSGCANQGGVPTAHRWSFVHETDQSLVYGSAFVKSRFVCIDKATKRRRADTMIDIFRAGAKEYYKFVGISYNGARQLVLTEIFSRYEDAQKLQKEFFEYVNCQRDKSVRIEGDMFI